MMKKFLLVTAVFISILAPSFTTAKAYELSGVGYGLVASTNNPEGGFNKFLALIAIIIASVWNEYVSIIQTPLAQLTILKVLVFLGLSFLFLMVAGILIGIWSFCFGDSDYYGGA